MQHKERVSHRARRRRTYGTAAAARGRTLGCPSCAPCPCACSFPVHRACWSEQWPPDASRCNKCSLRQRTTHSFIMFWCWTYCSSGSQRGCHHVCLQAQQSQVVCRETLNRACYLCSENISIYQQANCLDTQTVSSLIYDLFIVLPL